MSKTRIRLSREAVKELKELLSLDNDSLRQHSIGRLIREDFKARGWLKGKPRGRPGDNTKRNWDESY